MRIKFNRGKICGMLLTVLTALSQPVYGQKIFAHNDYLKPEPFFKAFELKVDYIEADIFLENGALVVAHTKEEIDPSKTLESMYLKPLSQNEIYGLTLMIDIKSDGRSTMAELAKLLEKYRITNLTFVVSGDYPPPTEWNNYPNFIWFDGRPGVDYTADQKLRLKMISTSFPSVSGWDGKGDIPKEDLERIRKTIDEAHRIGQPMRFWGSPDLENAWKKFIEAGVDVLNSDHIVELLAYLNR